MSWSGPRFDADNHYYETRDAFTRHMEPRLRDKAIHFRTDASGRDILMIGERPFTFLENLFQDRVAPPGMLREMLRNVDGARARRPTSASPCGASTSSAPRAWPAWIGRVCSRR